MSPEYLAGIVDGEGHIRMSTSNYTYRYVRIQVVNTHRPLLEAIQRHYGGSICVHGNETKAISHGWRPSWTWNTAGPNAERILKMIQPFLIVKKDTVDRLLSEAVYWCGEEFDRIAVGA